MVALTGMLTGCVTENDFPEKKVDHELAKSQYVELGLRHIQNGDLTKAMRPLQRAREIAPKSPEVHSALAYLFQAQGEPDLADQHFSKALNYSKNKTSIQNNYAAFLYAERRYPDACRVLEKASKDPLYDRRPAVFENLGFCYLQLNKNQQALAAFEKAVKLDPYQTKALLEAAWLFFDNHKPGKAKAYHAMYKRYVRLRRAPNNPRYLALGIKLASHFGDKDQEASYRLQLKHLFPKSAEGRAL